jgi:hypothetical protein
MRKRSFIFLFAICFSAVQVCAQDIAGVFREVNTAYAKASSMSMQIQYKLYTNYISVTPYESSAGEFVKQNNNYYSSLLGITTIQNNKYKLSISDNEKTIIVSDPHASEKSPSVPQIDSMLAKCSSSELKTEANGYKNCILHFEKNPFSEFDRIEIEINTDHFVSKLVMFYREAVTLDETNPSLKKEKPRLEISYSSITAHPVFAEDQFSEKKYISADGKKIALTPSFATYRLLNYKN